MTKFINTTVYMWVRRFLVYMYMYIEKHERSIHIIIKEARERREMGNALFSLLIFFVKVL